LPGPAENSPTPTPRPVKSTPEPTKEPEPTKVPERVTVIPTITGGEAAEPTKTPEPTEAVDITSVPSVENPNGSGGESSGDDSSKDTSSGDEEDTAEGIKYSYLQMYEEIVLVAEKATHSMVTVEAVEQVVY